MPSEQTNEVQVAHLTQPTPDQLKPLLESLLFVADGPVPLAKLARTLGIERDTVEVLLADLHQDYATRGLRLQRLDGRVQMVTAPDAAPFIESFLGLGGDTRLSNAALETLAIVAYRQPVTRAGIEALRGVNCDRVVLSLLNRGLITEVGRAETAGRPTLFGTTFAFLEFFGLTDLTSLPPLGAALPTADNLGQSAPDEAKGGERRGSVKTRNS